MVAMGAPKIPSRKENLKERWMSAEDRWFIIRAHNKISLITDQAEMKVPGIFLLFPRRPGLLLVLSAVSISLQLEKNRLHRRGAEHAEPPRPEKPLAAKGTKITKSSTRIMEKEKRVWL